MKNAIILQGAGETQESFWLPYVKSDNDPWSCDDKQGKRMFDKLGGTLIVRHDEGHMGSDSFNQPYKEFPLIIKLVENKLWGSKGGKK